MRKSEVRSGVAKDGETHFDLKVETRGNQGWRGE